mgnify:CR=1 FL=1
MKKILTAALCCLLCLSIAACGRAPLPGSVPQPESSAPAETIPTEELRAPETTEAPTTTTTTVAPTTTTTAAPTTKAPTTKAPTTKAPTTKAAASDTVTVLGEEYGRRVLELLNAERAKEGLIELTMENEQLMDAAVLRAKELPVKFDHTRPNGERCFTALAEMGVQYMSCGENIAYGQSSPAAVVQAWMNSSGHRANILSRDFTTIGVGYTVVNGTAYWSQFFTA